MMRIKISNSTLFKSINYYIFTLQTTVLGVIIWVLNLNVFLQHPKNKLFKCLY
jgi:hypothetical protein